MALTKKQILLLAALLGILFLLPATLFLAQQRQEIRKKASESIESSKLSFVGPNQVKVGEKFSVNILLDTTGDPNFTISGVDAVVSLNPADIAPTCQPRACPMFDLPPTFCEGGEIVYPKPVDPCGCPPFPQCKRPETGPTIAPQLQELTYEQSLAMDYDRKMMVAADTRSVKTDAESSFMPPIYRKRPIVLNNVTPGKIFDNYPLYPAVGWNPYGWETSLVGQGGSGTTVVTGTVVNLSQLPTPTPGAPECPPFPGCMPEGSGMPWNTCWGEASKLCPKAEKVTTGFRLMEVACTDDAKQCPDGSYVGRSGPRCEFSPCNTSDTTATPSATPSLTISKSAPGYLGPPEVVPDTPIGAPMPPIDYWKPPIPENLTYFTVTGVKNYSVDGQGYFNGFSGNGIFATLNFVAQNPGKVEIKLVYNPYNGPSTSDDSNINGYRKYQLASSQRPEERLLVPPQTLNIEVVEDTSCIQRPACLDANPPCAVSPLPPGQTYCPKPTPAGCYYQQVQCFKAPCEPILVCPTTIPGPTCRPRPACLDLGENACKLPEPAEGWCPQVTPGPTCTPSIAFPTIPSYCFTLENDPYAGVWPECSPPLPHPPPGGFCPPATPTPTCSPIPSGCLGDDGTVICRQMVPTGGWCPVEKKSYKGLLQYLPRARELMSFLPWYDYRLQMDTGEIYSITATSTDITDRLKKYAGLRVNITGKLEDMELEGTRFKLLHASVVDIDSSVSPTPTPTTSACVNEGGRCGFGLAGQGACCSGLSCQAVTASIPPESICIKAITPTPISTVIPTEGATCDNSTGDADCSNKVDLADFEVWRKEFTGEQKTKKANFSKSGKTSLADFEIWRVNFFKKGFTPMACSTTNPANLSVNWNSTTKLTLNWTPGSGGDKQNIRIGSDLNEVKNG